jgi:hypothetical protein
MTTGRGITRPASFLEAPRPRRLRRLAVLHILAHPFAAARLLEVLAAEAATARLACHVVVKACAEVHYSPAWRR